MAPSTPPRGLHATMGLCVFAAVGQIAFWCIWFFVDKTLLATANTKAYYAFENAFPLADAWMAATCALAARALWRRQATALLWLLLAASASLYLGAMDVLFDLENGIYLAPLGDWAGVGIEIAINALTLAGGAWVAVFAWTNRRYFQAL
jgi:hypothetical protein